MNKILEDFLETDVYKNYELEHKIYFVMLVGSTAFGLRDERSDYDVLIFVNNQDSYLKDYYKSHYLIHKDGARLHWFVSDETIINFPYYRYVWSMAIYLHNKENVFVINKEKYEEFYDKKEELLLNSFKDEILDNTSYIKSLENKKEIEKASYSKHLYRYLAGWYLIKYKEFTEKQLNWLKILKRMRWIEDFDKLYKEELQETLLEIQESIRYFNKIKDEA